MTSVEDNDMATFEDIYRSLDNGRLSKALKAVRALAEASPNLMYDDGLESIESDYRLMLSYMERGFSDPQRENIYKELEARLYRLTCNMQLRDKIRTEEFFSDAQRRSGSRSFSPDMIRMMLESFVTDTAMLSLDTEEARLAKGREIYRQHSNFMQDLFCHIVVSPQWTESEAGFYEHLLASPTVDTNDAQMMVSAIMLSAMNAVDTGKFRTLVRTYLNVTDEKLKQKALVGWVFILMSVTRSQEETVKRYVNEALDRDGVADELADLQKQIVYCMNAEEDNAKIQRDIMPDLMKNNNLNITRFGITEKEEDPMADIFDPDASDRAAEKVEESFRKMMDMQKNGSDIYFGGFSQMKRFPFFNNVVNWFSPFYIEHPDISSAADKVRTTAILVNLLNNGPFCDSDKYSFTLALSSVIDHLPASMKEMFNSSEVLGPALSEQEMKQPAYIRRMVLQDLYRFFRLYPKRKQLRNPFSKRDFVFVGHEIFSNTLLEEKLPDLCQFAMRQKNKDALGRLIPLLNHDDPRCLYMRGVYELNIMQNPREACKYLAKLREFEPENKRVLSLLARAYFTNECFIESSNCYKAIIAKYPDDKTSMLNYCVALSKLRINDKSANLDEAVNMLYKLDYESPGTKSVIRVLAWMLMEQGRTDAANKEYDRLLCGNDVETGDWLSAGYCQWLRNNMPETLRLLREFERQKRLAAGNCDMYKELSADKDFLMGHGISETDIQLMADLVAGI